MSETGDFDRLLGRLEVDVVDFAAFDGERARQFAPASTGLVRILFVLKQPVMLTLPGRPAQRCGPGTVMVLPAGWPVTIGPHEPGLAISGATGLAHARLSDGVSLLDRANVPLIEAFGKTELIRHACLAMLGADDADEPGARAMRDALMKLCILAVLRRFLQRPGIDRKIVGALADPRLSAAVAAILDRPAAAHNLDNLAARANLTRSTFARLFAGAMGQSPIDFVVRTRLFHAAKLLAVTQAPVKSIAADVGFSSRSHFSRAFSETFGCDPTSYRLARDSAPAEAPLRQDLRLLAAAPSMTVM